MLEYGNSEMHFLLIILFFLCLQNCQESERDLKVDEMKTEFQEAQTFFRVAFSIL